MVIYKATNKVNGKIYVGQTTRTMEERRKQHEQSAIGGYTEMVFGRALKKYGIENFEWEVIDTAETQEELNKKEIYWIDKLKSLVDYGQGYNCDKGGNHGKHSEQTKKAIGDAQRGELSHSYGKTGALNPTSKKVIDLSTNIIYESAGECARALGLENSKVCAVCRGDRGSTGGKVFRYIDDNNNIINVECKCTTTREDKHIYNVDTMEKFSSFAEAIYSIGNKVTSSSLAKRLNNNGATIYRGIRWCMGEENIEKAKNLKVEPRKFPIAIQNLTTGEIFQSISKAGKGSSYLATLLKNNNGHCFWKDQEWEYVE